VAVASEDPPGVDTARVAAWLAPLVDGLRGPLQAELIEGGRSNLTYTISDGERTWVLRRPPLAHVLPTAHDMAREHRVIRALGPTAIPVPRVIGLCEDPGVLGVTFYVMERVDGHVVRESIPVGYPDTPQTRVRMSRVLVETLADLHGVVPADVGLEGFGKPAGFLERQVRRWWTQWPGSAWNAVRRRATWRRAPKPSSPCCRTGRKWSRPFWAPGECWKAQSPGQWSWI